MQTTTSAPGATTTVTDSSTSTTATSPPDEPVAEGKAVLTMSTGITRMEITSCSSGGESSINVSAKDDDGDVFEVKARNDLGVVTYRGPQETREGTIVRVTVGSEKGFNVVGALNGEEFTFTGKCA